jgi:uncharacterized protein
MSIETKYNKLLVMLKEMDRVIIAFSGGVDSTFLLKAASVAKLKDILAVTGISDSLPEEELSFTKEITSSMGIKHMTIETDEINNDNYTANSPDRCYYCKKELFSRLKDIAAEGTYDYILDGTNADDSKDWRPGRRAAKEEEVQSPLHDAGLTKNDIRALSKTLELATWNKPATPCLASRFPYGQKITAESLNRVHNAETFIRALGIKEFRVRSHAGLARIEVHVRDFPIIMNDASRIEIVNYLKSLGFQHITIDLQGFRTGSSNECLENNKK